MLPLSTLCAFFTASVLLALVPGPDNLLVLTQSAVHGRRAGLLVTLGLCSGLILHTLAVAVGVAALFQASASAFTVLKLLGAGYLVWLALRAFREKPNCSLPESGQSAGVDSGRLYRTGIVMNATNPKVSMFFLAFLPQFTKPELGGVTPQIVLLGGLFILATVLVFGGVAIVAGSIRDWFTRSRRVQLGLNRAAGAIYLGLAVKLATAER